MPMTRTLLGTMPKPRGLSGGPYLLVGLVAVAVYLVSLPGDFTFDDNVAIVSLTPAQTEPRPQLKYSSARPNQPDCASFAD